MKANNYINNTNIMQTPIEQAYQYETHSDFIKTTTKKVQFSPICIFCSHLESVALLNDGGSFRRCQRCRKDFKAKII